MIVIHPGEHILPELGEELGRFAERKLRGRGVEIRTRIRVTGVSKNFVYSCDGSSVPASTVVWTAGTTPNPDCRFLPCADDHGRIRVNEFLKAPEWPGVWALGDCTSVPDPQGKPYPLTER